MNTHTETNHTPGPWTASAPDGSYHDVIRIHADGRGIPVAICPQQASPALQVLSGKTNETTEAAANARLIAAAPELLEACKELIACSDECAALYQLEEGSRNIDAIGMNVAREILAEEKARAAITKATEGAQMGESAEGIRLKGNPKNPEPHHTRIVFPGGWVEVTRCEEGNASCDYWVHVGVGKEGCGLFTPDEDEEGWITDARLDQTDKHSAESNLGDFNRPELYHLAVRVTRSNPGRKGGAQ